MAGRKNHFRYFDGSLSEGFVALYTGKTIIMVGFALLGLFLPIFLYELFGYDAKLTILYFGVSSLIYALTVPLGGKSLEKIGYRRAIASGIFFGATFFAAFYFISPENLYYLIPFSLIVLTFYRILYWIPYHVSFTKISDRKNRARELSIIDSTRNLIGVFIPIISGFIITQFSFDALFVMAIILYGLSVFPYILMPRVKETFKFGYWESWRELVKRKQIRITLAFVADGAEGQIGALIWPIFIFELFEGNYLEVGAISTVIIGVTVLLQLIFGKMLDKSKNMTGMLRMGSVFYALGYLMKIFVLTGFQIFIVGTYHNFSRIFMRTPFDTLTYDIAADEGHFVDEFTVLHEMAIHMGKALMSGLLIILLMYIPLNWTFVVAAGAALLFNFLGSKENGQLRV